MRSVVKALLAFRITFLLVMLVSAAVLTIFYKDPLAAPTLSVFWAGSIVSVISGITLWFGKRSWDRIHAWAQIVWDCTMMSYLVSETGGLNSGLVLLYFIVTLLSTLLLLSRGAVVSGILTSLSFGIVSFYSKGWALFSDPNLLSRFLLVISVLSFFGGGLAYFARYRERLALSLQTTKSQFKDLSELYSAIIDHSPSGILSISGSNKVIHIMNHAARKILGDNLIGRKLDDSVIQRVELSAEARREQIFQIRGQDRSLGYQTSILPNGDWLVVFQDLTDIRNLEERVRLKDKLASVGQLAAGIAHEIRNPLASLSGSVQLLKSEMPVDSGSERLMKIVLRETDRLDALIKNFLIYAKPSELQLEEISIRKVVDEILELIRHQRTGALDRIKFNVEIEPKLFCRCDGRQLKQILWNLILNAVDAMTEGGRLEIMASIVESSSPVTIRIRVIDSGRGIPENIKQRIFDPFFTTKSEGTGLGLALVYQMVKAHGGNLGVESVEGRGAEFWVDLLRDGPSDNDRKVA